VREYKTMVRAAIRGGIAGVETQLEPGAEP